MCTCNKNQEKITIALHDMHTFSVHFNAKWVWKKKKTLEL